MLGLGDCPAVDVTKIENDFKTKRVISMLLLVKQNFKFEKQGERENSINVFFFKSFLVFLLVTC